MKSEPKKGQKVGIHNVEKDKISSHIDQDQVLHVFSEAGVRDGLWVTPLTEGVPTRMELDTEADGLQQSLLLTFLFFSFFEISALSKTAVHH